MVLDEVVISRLIIASFADKLKRNLSPEVIIAGGGPAGMVAGYYLAKAGRSVVLLERKLSLGGGMWGGGMMMNEIVVQEEARGILDELGITCRAAEPGYYLSDSVEAVSTLCSQAVKAGVRVFNLFSVEDVMMQERRVTGVVVNWTAVEMAKLHVDPLVLRCQYLIDATGHAAEVARVIARKTDIKLATASGEVMGERSLWAEAGEKMIVANTKWICPGVCVAGMAANAVFGAPRMGPVFGGMLLSGSKAARLISEEVKNERAKK